MLCVCTHLGPILRDPMDYSPPNSSVPGFFQARILEWVGNSSSRASSQPGDETHGSLISCIGKQVLYHWATLEAHLYAAESQILISIPDYMSENHTCHLFDLSASAYPFNLARPREFSP